MNTARFNALCILFCLFTLCCSDAGGLKTFGPTVKKEFVADSRAEARQPDTLPQDTLSIIATGDIMLGSSYPGTDGLHPDDAVNSFAAVAHFLKGDIIFGNLEGCLSDSGETTKCKDSTGKQCYAFRMPERYVSVLKKVGFNFLSLANNHVGDFGARGRKRTVSLLDSAGIKHAGLLSHPYSFYKKDDITYAFCAFSPNSGTIDLNNHQAAGKLISDLKRRADIVIVSFHGGGEGAQYEHVSRENEFFCGENRGNAYAFAHKAIDAGADVVLGHGPHVTRAVEVYKNKFIAYSLGNFCTYGTISLAGPNGIAPLLQLKTNRKGDFLYADVVSVKQDKINHLQIDPTNAAFKKMNLLTDQDFNGHRLNFEGSRITLKEE